MENLFWSNGDSWIILHVTFSLLGQNTQHLQLKEREVYFGSRLSAHSVYGSLAWREKQPDRGAWQDKAAQSIAARKQKWKKGARDKIRPPRSCLQWSISNQALLINPLINIISCDPVTFKKSHFRTYESFREHFRYNNKNSLSFSVWWCPGQKPLYPKILWIFISSSGFQTIILS